jgi:cell division protein FtsI (penicillin-binding protein 3)
MITAASAVANGGQLVAPRLVRAIVQNGRRQEVPPRVVRRTVSPQTAATLTTIMEAVVEEGTARSARMEGFTIAGKTGTAAKLEGGHYSKSDYNGSFVGFVPSREPAISVLVVIDSPHGKGFYGGVVAAPVFKRIAEQALPHLGVGPNVDPQPPLLVARHDARGPVVPTPARAPALIASMVNQPAAAGLMPDLRGMSAREAVQVLARIGLVAHVEGDGLVVEQDVPAGIAVERGTTCQLRLVRRPLVPEAEGQP